MRKWLLAAGLYNIAWGLFAGANPDWYFRLFGMTPLNYPEIWQCVAMIVGVYGVGYAAASLDPFRHWPVVLVGFLGKIFGPLGFAYALWQQRFPLAFGLNLVTNDLLWWIPFFLILRGAWKANTEEESGSVLPIAQALRGTTEANGTSLWQYSQEGPVLVVFLRHSGCTFCREAMADLGAQREAIAKQGTGLALVMMADDPEQRRFYGLADVPVFLDPQRALYRAFSLRRGKLGQLFGLQVWAGGLRALRFGVGFLNGDGFQMPGAFLLHKGQVVRSYRHANAADRPDYCELAQPSA